MSKLVSALMASGALAVWPAAEPPPAFKRVTTEKPIVSRIGTFAVGTLTVSPDGRRFAYSRKEDKGWVVEVDGKAEARHKEVGAVFAGSLVGLEAWTKTGFLDLRGIKPMVFSADSRHVAYNARDADSWVIIQDGDKGKPFKAVAGPVMSRDGQRLAYRAQVTGGWCVVADGNEGKVFEKVGPPAFSPDGRRVAYAARAGGKEKMVVDGVEGKAYDSLDIVSGVGAWAAFRNMVAEFPVFSADGRLAHHARQSGKWHVAVDGQESEGFEELGDIAFSPDGKRLAFAARGSGSWTVMVDGQAQGSFEKGPALVFSPDSRHIAAVAESSGPQSIVIDGRRVGAHDAVGLPTFSPDGNRVAYAAKRGEQWTVLIDGVAQKAYPGVGRPVFSPDGAHWAYAADQAKGRLVVVVDGVEGKTYDGLMKGASVVFSDNTHLHYLVVSQGRVLLVEEEIQAGS